jgi:solute carrier family 25 (mitochondrial citrate transporter), member 1
MLQLVAKTRTQLNRRLPDAAKLPWPPFGKAWYAGCTTLIIGNSLKAGIRWSPAHMRLFTGLTGQR